MYDDIFQKGAKFENNALAAGHWQWDIHGDANFSSYYIKKNNNFQLNFQAREKMNDR